MLFGGAGNSEQISECGRAVVPRSVDQHVAIGPLLLGVAVTGNVSAKKEASQGAPDVATWGLSGIVADNGDRPGCERRRSQPHGALNTDAVLGST